MLLNDETIDELGIKNYRIIQKKEGFKFGVDAVLLANFAEIKKGDKVMDLCSGTGIVPFIIAGKREAEKILGLEIQEEFVEMARRSSSLNSLNGKVEFVKGDLKNVKLVESLGKFNAVTVNPPYKAADSSILSQNEKEQIARFEIECNLDDVIKASKILLKDNGKLFMVHRPERMADIFETLRKYKIEPKKIRFVHPDIHKTPNIILIEAQNYGGKFLKILPPLYVYENGEYSKEINKIYGRD